MILFRYFLCLYFFGTLFEFVILWLLVCCSFVNVKVNRFFRHSQLINQIFLNIFIALLLF